MLFALVAGVTTIIGQPLLTGLELAWWAVAFSAAVLVFINIQSYYNDPRRRQFEEEWYEQFAAAQRRRYADHELEWRTKDLSLHFGYQFSDQETHDEHLDDQPPVRPRQPAALPEENDDQNG